MIDKLTNTLLILMLILQVVFIAITANKLEQSRILINALSKNSELRELELQSYNTLITILESKE